ncbi:MULTISPECIES: DUF1120 domain-containing protein [Pseudomonas]|jgi:type 1 fimbria pilin|uniref:DUF1120 domain-containing protein n=2 Tax=Pseudomonas TaxID=286 RepID=A0A4Y9TJJ7_PSEFL|nr:MULTISPECIES: DUF1120 domain-containing protein [Pseudomonas]CRM92310.1 hypothetical protein [Pseudomonas sp. 22 E 5]MCX9149248.1 DUF1120 domain-containing protein [Pseudomonas sp. TB1-B1]QXH67304.1 DUF1120 domain-containing protein [Pseudomonas asgharzadehiana]TFW44543.1 DUF1120 domain-containing protein [Pseudomonas fluorescens]TKJ62979.1 DUF1120 domain-containing protein [Pseudomonas sp. CFBP13506]
MKKVFGLAMGLTCLVASVGAYATTTPTGNLIVKGTISPAACNISIGAGGIIDYGTIRAAELSSTNFNPREERTTALSVNCGHTPARFGLTVTDLRAGTKVAGILGAGYTEAQNYGLGAPGGRRTGGYSVTLRNLSSGAVALAPIVRSSTASGWFAGDGKVSQAPSQHSWRSGSVIAPAAISQLNGVIAVRAVINRASALDLTGNVALDGHATLVLNYI